MKKRFSFEVLPMYLFTVIFVLMPLVFLVVLSFMQKSGPLSYEAVFTLDNYKGIAQKVYLNTFITSLKLSFITTVVTALIGYPFAYFMSRSESAKTRSLLLVLIILPFWTNALVRIYGFIILFRGNGIFQVLLRFLGFGGTYSFLYTESAVIMGMVYALLPFMILTLYSACSKIDASVIDAARDLGASPVKTFFTVAFPLTADGLISGITLVFIPSMGLFFISDLLGGGKVMIVGNLIKDQVMTAHNYPFSAAISVVMLITMLVCMEITRIFVNKVIKGNRK